MNTTMRFNITLPRELGLKLKDATNRSKFIAESLSEKFEREEKKRLGTVLAEGYKTRAKEDAALNQEFDHMTEDGI
ncbi:MAG TPA: hypothetical protein VNG32_03165 [Candidatus Dormibacteraeota bacterium]|nr:hypothetical protein [Candidatus Dormibacteraeota bacterium]